jgi:hypothetical protein
MLLTNAIILIRAFTTKFAYFCCLQLWLLNFFALALLRRMSVFIFEVGAAIGHNAHQCHKGLQEACRHQSLLYCTMARWMHAFQSGRESEEHKLGTGHSATAAAERHVTTVRALLLMDQRQTYAELLCEDSIVSSVIHVILTES